MRQAKLLRRIRLLIATFMAGLIISGITAFPLETELHALLNFLKMPSIRPIAIITGLLPWIRLVTRGLSETNLRYPFLAYGTDWLAFAHLVIAVVFIGPFRDPVRNRWVITFGLVACAAVIPLALIAGALRQLPFAWRLVDCSFGIVGAVPLWLCKRLIDKFEEKQSENSQNPSGRIAGP